VLSVARVGRAGRQLRRLVRVEGVTANLVRRGFRHFATVVPTSLHEVLPAALVFPMRLLDSSVGGVAVMGRTNAVGSLMKGSPLLACRRSREGAT
jgi:hypothetical protein